MSYTHITHDNRVTLAVLLRCGKTQKEIAKTLKKHPSTVKREVERNRDKDGVYRVRNAEWKTTKRRIEANQRFRKIENDAKLRRYIVKRLRKHWSPEQIAGRWQKGHGEGTICHETIYRFVYTKRRDLVKFLRCKKGKYRRRRGTRIREKQREELNKRRIDTRPKEVEERKEIGHWEGDTIVGAERTERILTHVERKSRYTIADKLDTVSAAIVREKTIDRFKKLPKKKRVTETFDNGTEFSEHEKIGEDTGMEIYFAYPYHSWERGTNENTNGLLREFFPKGSSFAMITQRDVNRAVWLLNNRPRKCLNYCTPREVFYDCALE